MKSLYIAIDFDGTCVTNEFPKIGDDIGAVPVLKKLVEAGHKLILNTMRSDIGKEEGDDYLTQAIKWFDENQIPLYGANENKSQKYWTKSPKVYAHVYIDDSALGCPLKWYVDLYDRPYVDWEEIESLLIQSEIIE